MELNDKIWRELKGGYRMPYDASIPLTRMENSDDPAIINGIWDELWNELHHQGDVGLASYLAVPHLVRIGIKKDLFDWNLLGICNVIEQQRHSVHNPELPTEFKSDYLKGLKDLREYVVNNLNRDLDTTTYTLALSTIATCDGRIKLGKAIMEMENEDLLDDFLEQF